MNAQWEAAQYEHLKLCAAKYAWPMRNKTVPSKRGTWGQWFALKFGEELGAYRARQKEAA